MEKKRQSWVGAVAIVSQLCGGTALAVEIPAAVQMESAARISDLEKRVASLSEEISSLANPASRADTGVPLHGFADVGYAHASQSSVDSDAARGFTLGTFSVYLTPQFGSNVKSLIELAFEYDSGGGLATDLERLQLGYLFNDLATVWIGRFHTPYGYWNTAFHHGAQIQTSVLRPKFIEFEDKGGILPTHTVGVWSTGTYRTRLGKLNYDLYIGNGNRIGDAGSATGVLDFNAVSDDNSNKLMGLNISYSFGEALDGLRLGIHGLKQEVSAYNAASAMVGRAMMNMLGAYAVFDTDKWEVLSEYYHFNNDDLMSGAGASHTSWAGFAQLAYRTDGAWMPYLRTEKAALNQSDAYFLQQASGRSYTRNAIGMRYDLDVKSAIKLEINHASITDGVATDFNEVRAQYAIRF